MGLEKDIIGNVEGKLIDASSIINNFLIDNVDEEKIVKAIKVLQTYTDIKDLDRALKDARKGSLESFLNDQLSDDPNEKYQVVTHLNKCARRSGKGEIAKLVGGDTMSIILESKTVKRITETDLTRIVNRVLNKK